MSSEFPERCAFVVERKNRKCKMKRQNSSKYCAQHYYLDNIKNEERMPCPLDPNHSCFTAKLQAHLKKCNAREKAQPVYFQKHINASEINEINNGPRIKLTNIDDTQLLELIKKVEEAHKNHVPKDPLPRKSSSDEEGPKVEAGDEGVNHVSRHEHQQAALVDLMKEHDLLTENTCFLEYGAGRGQMTCYIAKHLENPQACQFILVDRKAYRHKQEVKLKHELGSSVERIRIDIEHLNIGNLNITYPIVGVSKHLCGAASDMALRSLGETTSSHQMLKGVVIALCCHHQCTWNTYVGTDFLTKTCGFKKEEFSLLCSLCGWATCGSRDHSGPYEQTGPQQQSRYQRLGLSSSYREDIGIKCKRLLDQGRILYLQAHGLSPKLVFYVDRSLSLENVALVACK